MAGIKDILDIEQERSEPKDWQVIKHLFIEDSYMSIMGVKKEMGLNV